MKARTLSGLVIAILLIPAVYFGGYFYRVGVGLLAVLAYTELLMAFEKEKKLPDLIKIISYISLFTIFAFNVLNKSSFAISYKTIILLILIFLIPIIIYQDSEKYSASDAFKLIGSTLFLSLAFNALYTIREKGFLELTYLLIITISTDTFAYLTGVLFGKHKMIPKISPNKSWEGAIGGTIFGVSLASIFYTTYLHPDHNIFLVLMMTIILTIISQFGDLIFSALKRQVGIKDFSNLIPGHGGILDRLDSLILVVLTYMLIM